MRSLTADLKFMQPETKHLLQSEVNAKLRRGIFYSIFWLLGVGSAIAVMEGFKAKKLISQSGANSKAWVKYGGASLSAALDCCSGSLWC